jgi:hypothetical protein
MINGCVCHLKAYIYNSLPSGGEVRGDFGDFVRRVPASGEAGNAVM